MDNEPQSSKKRSARPTIQTMLSSVNGKKANNPVARKGKLLDSAWFLKKIKRTTKINENIKIFTTLRFTLFRPHIFFSIRNVSVVNGR
jgi:hypothetical protein